MTPPAPLRLWIEGIGAWMPEAADWPALRAWLGGAAHVDAAPARKPAPAILAAAERRRAPRTVLMALEAASQARAMSGRDAAALPSIFVSAHGDCDILDSICTTLARAPQELSPTRFHNSVHNAAGGYWTIATGSRAASTALCMLEYSFVGGLLDAATQVCAEGTPVLLAASDIAAPAGPLTDVIATRRAFACALVLAPERSPTAVAQLELTPGEAAATTAPQPRWRDLHDHSLSARGLPLLAALGSEQPARLRLALGPRASLAVSVTPLDAT